MDGVTAREGREGQSKGDKTIDIEEPALSRVVPTQVSGWVLPVV